MTPHTLEVLEFFRIAEIIAGYCKSAEARERCLQKRPLQDAAEITAAKELGRDILSFLQADEPLPIKNLPPLASVLKQLHTVGVCLTVEELYAAGLLALQAGELKTWAIKQKQTDSATCILIESIPPLPQTEQAVFSFIDKNGALREIPSLTAIRKKMQRIEADIEKTMRSYCTDESTKGMLQTPTPVLRNGRQVIAVRSNFKGRIKGIIHEYSQTGQSFYLEPESIVLRNNELMQAQAEYEQELHRLLVSISAKLAEEAEALERAYDLVLELDCAAAAARWAYTENGVFVPDTGNSQYFYLQAARHPPHGRVTKVLRISGRVVQCLVHFPQGISGVQTWLKTRWLKVAASVCKQVRQVVSQRKRSANTGAKRAQEREIVGINKVRMPRNLAQACSTRYIYARLPSEGLAAWPLLPFFKDAHHEQNHRFHPPCRRCHAGCWRGRLHHGLHHDWPLRQRQPESAAGVAPGAGQ